MFFNRCIFQTVLKPKFHSFFELKYRIFVASIRAANDSFF